MLKKILVPLFTLFFIVFATQIALADDLPNATIQISAVIQNLQAKGYKNIHEVKFDDGIYKAEASNADGKEIKLHINPQTNEITKIKIEHKIKLKPNLGKLSMLDIIKKVEKAGYHHVYKIEFKGKKYEIKALNKNGKKTKLRVNANTGEISKEGWFD